MYMCYNFSVWMGRRGRAAEVELDGGELQAEYEPAVDENLGA
jgi:hypothetical protein